MNIEEELKQLLSIAEEEEFAIFYMGHNEWNEGREWQLHIGNPSGMVMIGEVDGNHITEGNSLEAIITRMTEKLCQ